MYRGIAAVQLDKRSSFALLLVMIKLKHSTGSLSALFAFEAAARLGSFSLAALELNVTQAAISKQIKLLENNLGQALFHRQHRSVVLSDVGRQLFATVSPALSAIAANMDQIRDSYVKPVTISLSLALSQFWLMPRLPAFTQAHPDTEIRVISQDTFTDLRTGSADAALRFGEGKWEDGTSFALFSGHVRAMAAPSLIKAYRIETIQDVLKAPLIEYDTADESWITWKVWSQKSGLAMQVPVPKLSFRSVQDATMAAKAGQGVMLIWENFHSSEVAEGSLLPVPGPTFQSEDQFFLVVPQNVRPEAEAFIAWLKTGRLA